MHLTLSEINIYPVKSLGGIGVKQAVAGERGLNFDRRWMIADTNNRFITQREFPQMALIRTSLEESGIQLYLNTDPQNFIQLPYEVEGEILKAQIWDDSVDAVTYNKDADLWISDILKTNCRFLYMPDVSRRLIPLSYAMNNEAVSFADGFPYLIIGESSLQDLNNRLSQEISMNRFRPSFVFKGGIAFDEDKWTYFKIGKVDFKAVKPCARCIITTIEQETALKAKEPLATLSKYRKKDNQVLFGMNVIALTSGIVSVGDVIQL